MRIKRESWKIIELILIRYPKTKEEYECYVKNRYKGEGWASVYEERIVREVTAVESVYQSLNEEEKNVMEERYWNGEKKKVPYYKMSQNSYSEKQKKRIVHKIIHEVGKMLGEIRS